MSIQSNKVMCPICHTCVISSLHKRDFVCYNCTKKYYAMEKIFNKQRAQQQIIRQKYFRGK